MKVYAIICGLAIFFFISCSTQEDVLCESGGTGYLYKDGMEFVCPFTLQEKTADRIWIDYDGAVTILDSDVGDYFPLKRRNAPYAYGLSMKVPKKYFTEEQYIVSISASDYTKSCGESKEFVFHRVEENTDTVKYHSVLKENYEYSDDGKRLFFGLREMPSHDWYHVLNIGKCKGKNFRLKGEIVN